MQFETNDLRQNGNPTSSKQRKEAGFTLIELLMVIGIFGIVMVAMQAMFLAGMNVFNREQRESEARRQAYVAVEEMVKMIRTTPASSISLSGSMPGVYDQITLVSASGVQTRFYRSGNQILRDSGGETRMVANQIEVLRFDVNCDVESGVFVSYNSSTLEMTDSGANFADYDPELTGMVIRFENESGGLRYIYRRIADTGTHTLKLDTDFAPTLQPTNNNYAIGKTYQIYVKTRGVAGKQRGTEVLTGVMPRF